METGVMGSHFVIYDGEKLTQIREKIKEVFESECLLNDTTLLDRYNLTDEGDLVMILK
jgi:hypothetical protein